jgi:alpha-amylase/alpha-mannosidase (GH57 family)
MSDRYVCIHGHFYQPPRENPWLGVIEKQPSADPFHDWNERIFAECYAAGARARIHDNERRIVRLVNNFLNLSFNIGPTLFAWLARYHPHTTRRIVAADRRSCERLGGHGNALAQAYNHMIMPLAGPRDKHTQIIWGMADFEHRFGRRPEGMWLPECGVDMETISALISHGIKFIVLAPEQAARVRHFHDPHWQECAGQSVDPRRAYRVFERTEDGRKLYNRHLDVFFYHEGLSHGIAFQHLLRSAEKLDHRVEEAYEEDRHEPQLISAATDGESYGHHEPYGEMCLAFFFENLARQHDEEITNFSHFLARVPPTWEAEIWEGERGEGSSWSCAHGVDRWIRHCGCSTDGDVGWRQDWRAPLREGLEALRARLDAIFEAEGTVLLHDPWEARDDYIRVRLDPRPEVREAFLARHARVAEAEEEQRTRIWTLLEMQRYGMFMFTSCAWFFADIDRLEPVQNLRYARRALEYAAVFTDEDLEALLVEHLERAASNQPASGDGAEIYRRQVLPARTSEENIAACYVLLALHELEPPRFACRVAFEEEDRTPLGGLEAFRGVLRYEDGYTFRTTHYAFFAAHTSDREAACILEPAADPASARRRLAAWSEEPLEQAHRRLEEDGHLIRNLPREQRRALLHHILAGQLEEVANTFAQTYDRLQPLLSVLAENKIEPPEALTAAAESVLSQRFRAVCQDLAHREGFDDALAAQARDLLAEGERYDLAVDRSAAAPVMADRILEGLQRLIDEPDLQAAGAAAETLTALMSFSREVGFFFENGGRIENRYWYLLRCRVLPLVQELHRDEDTRPAAERAAGEAFVGRVHNLGLALNFSPDHLDRLVDFVAHAEPDEGEP